MPRPQLLPICCLIVAWLWFPQRTAGTEVVVLGTQRAIYLAVDSVAVDVTTGKRYSTCKIKHSGSFFWVNKGFVLNPERHFDAERIIQKAIKENLTFDEVVTSYQKVMLPTLQREGPYLRKDAKAVYDAFVHNDTPILQLYLVRSTTGRIDAGIVEFPVVNGRFTVEVVKRPASDPVCSLTSKRTRHAAIHSESQQ